MQKTNSYREGTEAEQEFIALRGSHVVREANWNENVNEHWD